MQIFAAIDLETSGLDVNKCEILDIAIVPLNQDFTVSTTIPEFTARVKAEHPETAEAQALQMNRLNPKEGESRTKVTVDVRQRLTDNGIEAITPVGQNLDFDLRFIGKEFPELSKVIRRHGRDSMRLVLAINDIALRDNDEPRFEKVSLTALKDALGITGDVQHNAFEDAKDAALVYKKLLSLLELKRNRRCRMVTIIISYFLSAALVIYLFKWYGVIDVVLFTLCAVTASQKKAETPVKGFLATLEAGIGIILIVVIILMLLSKC